MKHVVFVIPYGLSFRNIVCCDVLHHATARGVRATVLLPSLPSADFAAIRPELPADVHVERLERVRASLSYTYLKALKQRQYSRRTALDAFEIKYQRRRQHRPLFHLAVGAAERAGDLLLRESATDVLLARWRQPFERYYRRLLARLRPTAVALTKPGYHPDELPVIKAAAAFGVPTIAIDTSWDNMASKRPPYILPDYLTVWNSWMETEACEYYRFAPDRVTRTGGPQFDVLFRSDRRPDRASTMRALGLDPSRKLIVFSLNAPMYAPDNAGYIRLLLDGIATGAIEGRPSLIIRMHPFDRESQYDDVVRGRSDVVVQRGFAVGEPGGAFECLPTHADVERYGDLMAHADLLLNQASTTSLDAMATDVPVVNIAFDLAPTHPDASIARIYGFTHYRRIVDSRAVRLATSADELFGMMNAYLRDRSLDAHRRAEARGQFIAFSDGQAAFRIASRIWEIA